MVGISRYFCLRFCVFVFLHDGLTPDYRVPSTTVTVADHTGALRDVLEKVGFVNPITK